MVFIHGLIRGYTKELGIRANRTVLVSTKFQAMILKMDFGKMERELSGLIKNNP
jgi:hypothetical protein